MYVLSISLPVLVLPVYRSDRLSNETVPAFLKNPTNPDSNADSSSANSIAPLHSSTVTPGASGTDPSLAPAPPPPSTGIGALGTSASGAAVGLASGYLEPNYEVFDPLNWVLDGLVDFPYSYNAVQGLEAQGMA
jgi:hypothetical protein